MYIVALDGVFDHTIPFSKNRKIFFPETLVSLEKESTLREWKGAVATIIKMKKVVF
jgi:hypothetical protein